MFLNKIKYYYESISLVKKIFVIPLISILFGASLLYNNYVSSQEIIKNTHELNDVYIPMLEKSNANIAILKQLVETYSFIVTADEEDLFLQTMDSSHTIKKNLQTMKESDIFDPKLIKSAIDNYQHYNITVEKSIYEILNQKSIKISNQKTLNEMFQTLKNVQKDFDILNKDIKYMINQNRISTEKTIEHINSHELKNIITTYVILFIFSYLAFYFVNKRFKNLITTISTLSDNRYLTKEQIKASKNDQITLLANKINDLFENYNQLSEEKQKYSKIATIDQLTNIYNRYYLTEMLTKFDKEQRVYGIAILDIDKFKLVNDTYGHDIGDEVLKVVAKVLTNNVRKSDIVGRWGGEEFIIILNLDSKELLINSLEKVRSALENTPIETVGKVTASFGASINSDNTPYDKIMKEADIALYDAKHHGRNQVRLFQQ